MIDPLFHYYRVPSFFHSDFTFFRPTYKFFRHIIIQMLGYVNSHTLSGSDVIVRSVCYSWKFNNTGGSKWLHDDDIGQLLTYLSNSGNFALIYECKTLYCGHTGEKFSSRPQYLLTVSTNVYWFCLWGWRHVDMGCSFHVHGRGPPWTRPPYPISWTRSALPYITDTIRPTLYHGHGPR